MKDISDYQRGSVFGMVIVALAFAFALWVPPDSKSTDQIGRQHTSADAEQEGKGPIYRWWHWTITGDSAGFYTLGLIGVGSLQALFFIRQLVLMRNGLYDTKQAADAAKEQAKLARESLIANNRAWLTVGRPVLDNVFQITEQQIWATARLPIKNIGITPALQITVDIWIDFFHPGGFEEARVKARFEELRIKRSNFLELTLFPAEELTGHVTEYGFSITATRAEMERNLFKDFPRVDPLLLGCVTYHFPSDQLGRHQTRFAYRILTPTAVGLAPTEFPAGLVGLMRLDFFGSFLAD
ncbi:hypothetical protein [Lichenifustis flavocetrariae]|uniref:Uncharacterized protein n=1 Tax=Lichenifustis flavocetrariae TaxID=2949735 RepID=A0AA41YXJ4_9HYPH|nr:hypothetical protein [Lichenifustis flavocetrariae]MCW6509969.1 hypothetical protein [Lichenifustis flavocetrariae]